MSLRQLVSRLGLQEVARRLGVSVSTVRRWLRTSIPAHQAPNVTRVIKRHLAARIAREAQVAAATSFQDRMPMPVNPANQYDPATPLTPEQVLPQKPPRRYPGEFFDTYDSRNYFGEIHYIEVRQPLVEADRDTIMDAALSFWLGSGRDFIFATFVFYRYIAINPLYRGEMLRRAGTWTMDTPSTPAQATQQDFIDSFEAEWDRYLLWAESRLVWLDGVIVRTLDQK